MKLAQVTQLGVDKISRPIDIETTTQGVLRGLKRSGSLPQQTRVLDIASMDYGNPIVNSYAAENPNTDVFYLDRSKNMIGFLEKRLKPERKPNIPILNLFKSYAIHGNAEDLPFPDNCFDITYRGIHQFGILKPEQRDMEIEMERAEIGAKVCLRENYPKDPKEKKEKIRLYHGMFYPDMYKITKEAFRVLKPGGIHIFKVRGTASETLENLREIGFTKPKIIEEIGDIGKACIVEKPK